MPKRKNPHQIGGQSKKKIANNNAEQPKTSGKFSQEESRKVRQSIELYCKSHNITVTRLCSEIDNRTDSLRGAWMEIAESLPNRTVQSVYRHGMRLMHTYKRGAWTDQETALLKSLVAQHGNKWAEIASKLNRSPDSCRDKFREYSHDYAKGKWQKEESTKLEKFIREFLKVGDDVDMVQVGQLVESKGIALPWDSISQKMGDRSRLSCFKRYQKLSCLGQIRWRQNKRKALNATKAPSSGDSIAVQDTTRLSLQPATLSNTSAVQTATSTSTLTDPTAAAAAASTSSNSNSTTVEATAAIPPALTQISMSTPNPIHPDTTLNESTTVNEKSDDVPVSDVLKEDYDRTLIIAIASSSYVTTADVDWSSIRYPCGEAKDRWEVLLDTWVENMDEEASEEMFDRPIWEIARLMLSSDGNEEEKQAEIAARTVEAVFSI